MSSLALDRTAKTAVLTTHPCAKINLTLAVTGKRDDGYHELRSLVVGVDLRDSLTAEAVAESQITLTCSDPTLDGEANLAWKAAAALAARAGGSPGARITLAKHVPTGGGLGGGSSDAAAALRLFNRLWSLDFGVRELAAIGAELGSDVPLFFGLPAAVVAGRGELVRPVTLAWHGWALLVFTGPGVATADVYRAYRAADSRSLPDGTAAGIENARTAAEITPLLFNDLEPAVRRVAPWVARAQDALDRDGLGPMRISGAGSTLFRLFDDEGTARDAAGNVERMLSALEESLPHGGLATALGTPSRPRVAVVAAPVEHGSVHLQGEQHGNHRRTRQAG